jgi:hypothetical protein
MLDLYKGSDKVTTYRPVKHGEFTVNGSMHVEKGASAC